MSRAYPRRARRALSLVGAIVAEARAKDVPFMAGSIAYSAFVSLLPLLFLSLLAASFLGGRFLADALLRMAGTYLSPAGQHLLVDAVTRATRRGGLTILGAVVLAWGVLRVFRGLDTAFSIVYETTRTNTLLNQIQDGIIVLAAIGLAIVAVTVAGAVFAMFPRMPFAIVVNPMLLIVGLTVAFLPIYYVFPDADVSVREVVPGAVVAAVGWAALELGFGVYVASTAAAELYGIIGGIILLVTWLYFAAIMLLIGAVTNVVLSGHEGAVAA